VRTTVTGEGFGIRATRGGYTKKQQLGGLFAMR
jgi:hypothetical protein